MSSTKNGDPTHDDDLTDPDPAALPEHAPLCEALVKVTNRLDSVALELGRIGRDIRRSRTRVARRVLGEIATAMRPALHELKSAIEVFEDHARPKKQAP